MKYNISPLCNTHTRLSTGLLPLWRESSRCKSCLHTHEVDQQHSVENHADAIFGKWRKRMIRKKLKSSNSPFQVNCNERRRWMNIGSCTKPMARDHFSRSSLATIHPRNTDRFYHVFKTREKVWSIKIYAVGILKQAYPSNLEKHILLIIHLEKSLPLDITHKEWVLPNFFSSNVFILYFQELKSASQKKQNANSANSKKSS